MIRVLYIIDTMFYAGTQTHIASMMRRHDRSRFSPYLLCLQEAGPLGGDLEAEGYPVTSYGLKRVYASQAALSYPGYLSFLMREKIDIVHAYLFAAQLYGIPGARLAGVPLVIAGRRGVGVYWTEPRYAMVRRMTNALAHLQIANSHAVEEFVVRSEGVPPGKVRVVYNGIDTERFSPAPPAARYRGDLTVGYVGNLTLIKQVDVLIRAVARLAGAFPRLQLRIVGKGPGEGRRRKEGDTAIRVRTLAAELGLGERVRFVEPQRDVERQLREMDIFVLPSVSEGMSNAMLEAMATGLPVIATDSGGNREVIRHGHTGYLFPSGDDEALVAFLRGLIEDPEKRRAMGQAAREAVMERFTTRRMVADMETIYVEELEKRRR